MRTTLAVHMVAGALALTFGYTALFAAKGSTLHRKSGIVFVYLLAGIGDVRVIRAGGIRGTSRLARHLRRMSWALWIAASSFFFGQAKVIPKPIRIPALLAFPVLVVLVAMLYWLWRVRIRRSLRGIVGVSAPDAAIAVRP
jgi:hypothetical protein